MTIDQYTRSRTVDGFVYQRGIQKFYVEPFAGGWRASNGPRYVFGATAEEAAQKFVEAV